MSFYLKQAARYGLSFLCNPIDTEAELIHIFRAQLDVLSFPDEYLLE